jgi:hypothetical protein
MINKQEHSKIIIEFLKGEVWGFVLIIINWRNKKFWRGLIHE